MARSLKTCSGKGIFPGFCATDVFVGWCVKTVYILKACQFHWKRFGIDQEYVWLLSSPEPHLPTFFRPEELAISLPPGSPRGTVRLPEWTKCLYPPNVRSTELQHETHQIPAKDCRHRHLTFYYRGYKYSPYRQKLSNCFSSNTSDWTWALTR